MSYLVLARKWRPLTFDQVVNQKHVVVTLQNAITSDRIANAYLFTGPRGVGKTTVARILAKAINCEKGPTITPCNECSSCVEITDSRSLDVFEIDGASNRGIDEVRNLRENLKYAPTRGKYKIYIIDEVHMLTTEAFNALLKTLEEPPTKVLFIFATTEPHKIPATILSRCQRFDFKRITNSEIIQQLKKISEKENIHIDDEALHLIAKKAEGGMRDAQSLLDQAVSFCGDKITRKEIIELLGIIDQEIFFRVSDIIKNKDKKNGLLLIDEIFFNGFSLNEFLVGLNEHLRNILILKSTNSIEQLEISENYANRYSEIVNDFQEEDLLRLIKIVSDTEYTIKRSSNPRLKLELALMKMIKLDSTKSLENLLDGIHELRDKMLDTSQVKSYTQIANSPILEKKNEFILKDKDDDRIDDIEGEKNKTPEKIETVSIEEVKNVWPHIIDEVKKSKIALGSFLNEGIPSEVDGNILTISFRQENGFHIKSIARNYKIIENVLMKFLNVNLKIKCIKDESLMTEETKVINSENLLTGLAQRVPQIKTIMEVFDGEIVR